MTAVFGILGDPVEHSLSPIMHLASFEAMELDCDYHAFHVKPESLISAIYGAKALGIEGLNITIPHKEHAMLAVDPDPLAAKIGAINTIALKDEIRGYNTDGYGALQALAESGVSVRGQKVLILGAGGAARAIAFTLHIEGAEITIANRTQTRAITLADEVGCIGLGLEEIQPHDADIIINTSSVGMHPYFEESLLSPDDIRAGHVVFDIVYNPIHTRLLRDAEKAGATTIDGVKMLVYQGAESERIWLGVKPPVDIMEEAVRRALQ